MTHIEELVSGENSNTSKSGQYYFPFLSNFNKKNVAYTLQIILNETTR